ncbi:unnamed protein product [Prorocentrum cordatum]|uniref:Uncharacterized protein n=1 Tax=Prorocentrum cordatum TaxID=2364126 RepID=A0ABN9S1F6_9DINO|nr:unnamed protein product [Polarella glacialis]
MFPGLGMASGSDMSQMQAAMILQNPEMAQHFTRQAAEQYELQTNMGLNPEVKELAEHFNLEDRCARALDQQLKLRKDTFTEDMAAIWDILEGARSPSGLLMVKVREMAEGTFRGFSTPEEDVQKFAKQYKLDVQASAKLAEVLAKRQDPKGDMEKIGKHLERSNKPSALMMLMLKDLRLGNPVQECSHAPAIGSKVHNRELEKEKREKRSRSRRDRDRRSRDAGRDRDRHDRDRDRRRSRERSRDRRR